MKVLRETYEHADRVDRVSAVISTVLVLILAFALTFRPVIYGVSFLEVVRYLLFFVTYLVLPGFLVYLYLEADNDWLLVLGMSLSLGLALIACIYSLLRVLNLTQIFPYYALINLPLIGLNWKNRHQVERFTIPISKISLTFLLSVILLSIGSIVLYPIDNMAFLIPLDLIAHLGHVAEVRNHWPLNDPRAAGIAFNYHFFSYAFPAAANQVTSISIYKLLFAISQSTLVALFTLQYFNVGKSIFDSSLTGLFAVGSVILLGNNSIPWFLEYNNNFDVTVFYSISTLIAYIFFISWVLLLHRCISAKKCNLGQYILLGVFSLAASGAKGHLMPVALFALGLITI